MKARKETHTEREKESDGELQCEREKKEGVYKGFLNIILKDRDKMR